MKEKGEENSEIVEALVRLFRSMRKCHAIRQYRDWMDGPWFFDYATLYSLTPLHIVAQEGEWHLQSNGFKIRIDYIKGKS